MKIGIIGLPQSGKKTIFDLLTSGDTQTLEAERLKSPVKGIAHVRDPRLGTLAGIYKVSRRTQAKIEVVLMPGIDKESIRTGGLFKDLDDADAICHIVRAFEDDSVYHAEGSVDAARDIDNINNELVLADLLFLEKRQERIEKAGARGEESDEREKELILKFKSHLEDGHPLRALEITGEEKKIISSYPFLTLKPMLIVLNAGEDDAAGAACDKGLTGKYSGEEVRIACVSAKIEKELASIEDAEERREFLKGMGIDEPATDKLTRLLYEALGLISFFTANDKEVRNWMVRRGATALEAAGVIHSDIKKGFIRAEVIKYEDLNELGSEVRVKEAGRLLVKGKDYEVSDGDILHIRFNV